MSKLYLQEGLLEKKLPKYCVTCENFEISGYCNLHHAPFDHEDYCNYWQQNNDTTAEKVVEAVDAEIIHCTIRTTLLEDIKEELLEESNVLLNNTNKEDN